MIYKYFPKKPVGIIGDGHNQKYFTENAFESAVEAKEFLAIPYEPLYRIIISPHATYRDNPWEVFEGSVRSETKRRVWAAFGRHGGAWEMVTKQQFSERNENNQGRTRAYAGFWSIDKILYTGGYIEEYSCFKKATEHNIMLNLLKQFLQNYKKRGDAGDFGETKEGFQWKIPDEFLGGIFYWVLRPFEYTISVLVKTQEEFYNGVRFWGIFWEDKGDRRTAYRPIEVVIPGFPLLTEREMCSSNKSSDFEQFLHDRFDDVRKTLVRKSMPITPDRVSESYDIQFP